MKGIYQQGFYLFLKRLLHAIYSIVSDSVAVYRELMQPVWFISESCNSYIVFARSGESMFASHLFKTSTERILPSIVDPDSRNPDLDPASIASESGSGSRVW
jgi:hypothetical protein